MSSKRARGPKHHHAFNSAFSKVAAAGRRLRRNREKRGRAPWLPGEADDASGTTQPAPQFDAVRIVVLAMESLGRASMRAASTGRAVEVAAPDDAIAAVFRAALNVTARTRLTDQLVRVVVD